MAYQPISSGSSNQLAETVHPKSPFLTSRLVDVLDDDSVQPPLAGTSGQRITAVRRKPIPDKHDTHHETFPLTNMASNDASRTNGVPVQRIYWVTPVTMVAFALLGVVFAHVHHFYYRSLNSQPLNSFVSEWAIRIGTALAFLTRASLVAAASISYRQHYWTILRSRSLTISSIDNIMNAFGDITAFGDIEMITHAWSAVTIATVVWCLPLAAIAPPASLTVIQNDKSYLALNETVNVVDWTSLPSVQLISSDWVDAGQDIYRMTAGSVYGNSILPMSFGYLYNNNNFSYVNYSYPLAFYGPRFRCSDVQADDQQMFNTVFSPAALWLPPDTYPHNSSAPNEWWLYNTTDILSANGSSTYSGPHQYRFDFWMRTQFVGITCQSWNVSYGVVFNFTNGVQNVEIRNITYLERLIPDDPTRLPAGPMFGYASWFKALIAPFKGHVSINNLRALTYPEVITNILQTGLSGCQELRFLASNISSASGLVSEMPASPCVGGSLAAALEHLSENVTLSYFSYSIDQANSTAPLTIYTDQPVYHYNARSLLASYGSAIGATVLIMLVAAHAMYQNGTIHSSKFSAILCNTRNSELDDIAYGHWYAAQPLAKVVGKQKLKFGLLANNTTLNRVASVPDSDSHHVGFGVPESVTELKKKR